MHGESEKGPPEPDPQPASGCPAGPAASPVEVVSGVATSGARLSTIDHGQVAVYRYTLEPGGSTGWHFLPDPGFVLPVQGSIAIRQDCGPGIGVRVGQARLYSADTDPQLVVNNGTGRAEFVVVVFNIPNAYPVVVADTVPGVTHGLPGFRVTPLALGKAERRVRAVEEQFDVGLAVDRAAFRRPGLARFNISSNGWFSG